MILLLKKEFRLCLHPAALVMLATSALLLVPNYPFGVSFFYMALGIFFICLDGRENHDAAFTLALPVSRREAVRGRVLFCACLELMQLALCAAFAALRSRWIGADNQAGMDGNLALIGQGFLLFGVFNIVFFPAHYRDIGKVGVPFALGAAAMFLLITLDIVATYAVPFVRDVLDTPDPAHLGAKLACLAAGAAAWLILTGAAIRVAARRFEALDLQL